MGLSDDYNKAAKVIRDADQRASEARSNGDKPAKEDLAARRSAVKDVVQMQRQTAREGKTFVRGATGYELQETGPSKSEAQREYLRKFNNDKPTGAGTDKKTDRQRAAERLGVKCPA